MTDISDEIHEIIHFCINIFRVYFDSRSDFPLLLFILFWICTSDCQLTYSNIPIYIYMYIFHMSSHPRDNNVFKYSL